MNCYVGIDLGSTTTKAVILDENGAVVGRGITNSRSNYDVACQIALTEALINARFWMVASELDRTGIGEWRRQGLLAALERNFRKQQYLDQLLILGKVLRGLSSKCSLSQIIVGSGRAILATGKARPRRRYGTEYRRAGATPPGDESAGITLQGFKKDGTKRGPGDGIRIAVERILEQMEAAAEKLFSGEGSRKSDFFRDLAGSCYLQQAEVEARSAGVGFDLLAGLYDQAILEVENTMPGEGIFQAHASAAWRAMDRAVPELAAAVERAAGAELRQVASAGTGYGRQRLPFLKSQIRSEVLCHGLGAHAIFPGTRTVLDIGGQDMKAIQLDEQGLVTSFQMNDRCAAGCGRYLGYIADDMNIGLHELGPLAARSCRPVRINSTCTVFAGAELRQRLSLGEKREDILAGLHRAIILRAMSLLARSGGIRNEFTFTGGVAKNDAAVGALRQLVAENYGQVKLNISPDSIYMGALGAALFALQSRPPSNMESCPQKKDSAIKKC